MRQASVCPRKRPNEGCDLPSVTLTSSLAREIIKTVCSGLAVTPSGKNVEVSGLLLGKEIEDKIVITSAVTGDQVSTEMASELGQDFIASVAHGLATGKTDERIVGMFHSHPALGIFVSQQDAKTMINFQRLSPRFVMMIVDPLPEKPDDRMFKFFRFDFEQRRALELPFNLMPEA